MVGKLDTVVTVGHVETVESSESIDAACIILPRVPHFGVERSICTVWTNLPPRARFGAADFYTAPYT